MTGQSNDLRRYFDANTERVIHKWDHYFEVYDRHFGRFRNREIVVLEIGISHGGSLQMWKNYFGPKAKIYGVDVDPRCKQFEEENVEIMIGSQSDRKFLRSLKTKIPPIDVFIDDGGHTMKQQIVTFEEMFDHIKIDGIYLCEDCHTSYFPEFGGGYKRPGTFIEYSKNWIDYINAYHSRSRRLKVDGFTRTAKSLHYYDSIVIIEKGNVPEPANSQTGKLRNDQPVPVLPLGQKILVRIKSLYRKFLAVFNLKDHID